MHLMLKVRKKILETSSRDSQATLLPSCMTIKLRNGLLMQIYTVWV